MKNQSNMTTRQLEESLDLTIDEIGNDEFSKPDLIYLAAVFLSALIAVLYYYWINHGNDDNSNSNEDNSNSNKESDAVELRSKVIKAIMTDAFTVNEEDFRFDAKGEKEQRLTMNECSICIEKFKVDDTVTKTTCLHVFHTTCIFNWAKIKDECPICRQDMWDHTFYKEKEEQILADEEIPEVKKSSRDKKISEV